MRKLATALVVWLGLVGVCLAQDVTLSARDGSVTVDGTLLSFDGEFYRIDTAYGPLTLDGTGVTCTGPGCPKLTDFVSELTWSGPEPLISRVVPRWIEGFATAERYVVTNGYQNADRVFELAEADTGNTTARIILKATSPDDALTHVATNESDLALIRIDPSERHRDAAVTKGFAANALERARRVVALDAAVAAVSPENSVADVSIESLADMLSGAAPDWTVAGGADMPITLHLPAAESAVRDVGSLLFPEIADMPSDLSGASVPLSRDPFGLGLRALSEAEDLHPLALRGPCGIVKTATPQAIKTDDYPMVMPIYLYASPGRLPRIARELIGFARGDAGQAIVREAGLIDLSVTRIPFGLQGDRLGQAVLLGSPSVGLPEVQRMVEELQSTDRLTVAFRFEGGSAALDSHSRANIRIMADAMERGEYDGEVLIIAGFSDGQGDAASNLRLSRQRARVVRDALLAALPTPGDRFRDQIEVQGYGEASPIACDEEPWGRRLNRRVEIWVRQR